MKKGFLVIEALLAAAMFVVFATGMMVAVVGGWNANRLGKEETVAVQYASEGLEAMRSIRNRGFNNLKSAACTGVDHTAGYWTCDGTSDPFDKYTRTITVSNVNRDAAGNIVPAPTGTLDPETKKVTSTVNWNFTAAKPDSVSLANYFTSWKSFRGGLLVYGDTTTTPKYRNYDVSGNIFDAEKSTLVGTGNSRSFALRTSPIKNEAIAGWIGSTGTLNIMCFDGVTWTNEWSVSVGGTGTTKRFAIAYENASGDVVVAYARSAAGNNAIDYRTKLGTTGCGSGNWAAAASLPASPAVANLTTGVVAWIRMEASPVAGSDRVVMAWSDGNSDLGVGVWNGSAWGNFPAAALETNLEYATAAGDTLAFDLAIESLTGNAMVVWGLFQSAGCSAAALETSIATTNCIRYSRFTSFWAAVRVITVVADPATNIDMTANPSTNELIVAALDNSQADLSIAYWSGSAWTGRANQDTSTQAAAAGTKLVATGWLKSGSTTRSIVTYNDSNSTALGYFYCNVSTCTKQNPDWNPSPTFGNPRRWVDIYMDPYNLDRFMYVVADTNSDLFAKRLVMSAAPAFAWTDADGGAVLETTLGQAIASPFGFAYWRMP